MKKQIIYSLLALTTVCLGACNNNDEIDTANSIFSTEPLERNACDHKYNLVPADYDKAVAL